MPSSVRNRNEKWVPKRHQLKFAFPSDSLTLLFSVSKLLNFLAPPASLAGFLSRPSEIGEKREGGNSSHGISLRNLPSVKTCFLGTNTFQQPSQVGLSVVLDYLLNLIFRG